MALNKNKNLKRYFTIKEVAQKLDVTESTLRYWEKEFASKNTGGDENPLIHRTEYGAD